MPKFYRCCCQVGGHYSKKSVSNCYNKKKKQSAQRSVLYDDGMNDSIMISSSFSKPSLHTQTTVPKPQINDETLIHCNFVRSLRDQKDQKPLSILQEINAPFWKNPQRRQPAKGRCRSKRFISIINKRNELIEELKHRFQIYMDRNNILPPNPSMLDLRKNLFKKRRNYNYASQIFEAYVSKFQDRRQFGNIEKMTAEFEDLIKFLKGCSYKRLLWILKRSKMLKESMEAGIETRIDRLRQSLLKKFLHSYPRELTYRFNSIFTLYFNNIGDRFAIENFWRSTPGSRLKDYAQDCVAPQIRAFLELNNLPIRDNIPNLPADEAEWLKRRERKSDQEHSNCFEQPFEVPQIRMGTGFRPFPGLRKPVPVPASAIISVAEYRFSKLIPTPKYSKYKSFSEQSMWKISRTGIIIAQWLQHAFDKIVAQSMRRKSFLLDLQAKKTQAFKKSQRRACNVFADFIYCRSWMRFAFATIYCVKRQQMNEQLPEPKKPTKPWLKFFRFRSNLGLYSQEEVLQTSYLPKMKGKNKDFECMDYQKCSKKTCPYWLEGQILECADCNAAYHKNCWSKTDECAVCQVTTQEIAFKLYAPFFSLSFKSMKMTLTQPPEPISEEETLTAIQQVQDSLSTQIYCVTNCFQDQFRVYPFYNPKLKRLCLADQEIIDQYDSKNLAFPVIIEKINSTKGRGLTASRIIQKGELVSTYSGNVVSLAQASKFKADNIKDYLFHLINGPDVQNNFVVFPKDYASAGFFMNHTSSKNKVNVNAFIAIHKNGPIILMQAIRKIKHGEELLYNYNAQFVGYNTEGFE